MLNIPLVLRREILETRSAVYQIAIFESNNRIFGRAEGTEKDRNREELSDDVFAFRLKNIQKQKQSNRGKAQPTETL